MMGVRHVRPIYPTLTTLNNTQGGAVRGLGRVRTAKQPLLGTAEPATDYLGNPYQLAGNTPE